MWSPPRSSALTKARPDRLETVSHWSAAIGVPLLVTVPSAGSPPSGQLNQTRYSVMPLPLTEKMLLSGTDCPAATVWLVAVTTGAGMPGSVIVTCEELLQEPL